MSDSLVSPKSVLAMGWLRFILLLLTALVPRTLTDLPAIPSSFCLSRDDGIYGLGCSPYFVICKSGIESLRSCSGHLYFDDTRLTCVPKANSQNCIAPKQSVLAESLPPRVAPTAFTCVGKIDGVYKQHCSGLFVVCSNQEATFLTCPRRLIYDGVTAKCQKKVKGCNAVLSQNLPFTPAKHITAFSCKSVLDGYYPQIADDFVIKCLAGKSTLLSCPKGLIVSPRESLCVKTPLVRKKRFIDYDYSPASFVTDVITGYDEFGGFYDISTTTIASLPSPLPFFPTCVGLTYGVHVFGCSDTYIIALPDYCSKYTCPANSVYNEAVQHCTNKDEVTACNRNIGSVELPKVLVTTVAPAVVPASEPLVVTTAAPQYVPAPRLFMTTDVPQYVPAPAPLIVTTATPVVPILPPSEFDCSNQPDGAYDLGCSEVFAVCTNGDTKYLSCGMKMKFDSISGRCLGAAFVVACGGTSTPLPVEVTPAPVIPLPASYAAISPQTLAPVTFLPVTVAPTTAVAVTACTGKTDGIYSMGCKSNFYSCVKEVPNFLTCPNGLVFDDSSARCLSREYVTRCGGTSRSVLVRPTSCGGYLGVISRQCREYTVCLGSLIVDYKCPFGYFFNIKLHRCISQTYPSSCV